MERKIVGKIFQEYSLGTVDSVKKIEIGFTNKVYLINDEYILKVCEDEGNERKFEMEVFLYDFFKDKIAVPQIELYDNTKKIYNKFFMIYPKIEGDNLYSKWHLLNNTERKSIVGQLCNILRIINNAQYDEFIDKFNDSFSNNWKGKIVNRIQNSLIKVEQENLLSPELIGTIKKFVSDNQNVLDEQKIGLVYWDAHFDNILVRGTEIVGILDFERTELSSIDFVLDIIKRMAEYPKKYMSEESEKFAKKEDYVQLLEWFQEFYPELFDFENLETRLGLYIVMHDLDALISYPNSQEVKMMIAKTMESNLRGN